jgi:hypothetical protein
MKLLFLLLGFSIMTVANSCVLLVGPEHDNGKHKGWYKNPNNPHNPEHHEENGGPGHGNQKGNAQGKNKTK